MGLKCKDKIQFPVYACSIPTLSGINMIPYLQLFEEATRLAFASATMPEQMAELLKEIAEKTDWQCRQVVIEDVPFQFKFTVLKMQDRLSLERQTKITQRVDAATDEKTRMLLVTSKKSEAIEVYGHLKNSLPEKVFP
jgi:CRISPR/Cas system-associated endonuclease/helicase Cas3